MWGSQETDIYISRGKFVFLNSKLITQLSKTLVNAPLGKLDLMVVRRSNFKKILQRSEELFLTTRDGFDLDFLNELIAYKHLETMKVLNELKSSRSQLRQDLLVLWLLDFSEQGVFVEFGATDGVDLSNTYLLEHNYGWTGVLAEPAKIWHHDLVLNRHTGLDFRAVSSESGKEVTFYEGLDARFSSIHKNFSFKYQRGYIVQTVNLIDLLTEHNLPHLIDYLSIDTEGSEYDVLKNFDFNKFKFKVVTVEYSTHSSSEVVTDLMVRNGYQKIFSTISKYEDWFINPDFVTLPAKVV